MEQKLTFDWHTHTVYSHGKGTIEDNVKEARRKGLTSVAITDHGPGHIGYGFRRSRIPYMRAEIDAINRRYDDIRVYMSVEANIINSSGELDVKPEEFELYDFVIAGYHFGTLGANPFASLALHGRKTRRAGSYDQRIRSQDFLFPSCVFSVKRLFLTPAFCPFSLLFPVHRPPPLSVSPPSLKFWPVCD